MGSHIQRAKARGLVYDRSIERATVFELAGWRCQICTSPTPRHLSGTLAPAAPELDHVVPLAAGGTHTWDNVQCACRACNGRKGDAVPSVDERDLWASRRLEAAGQAYPHVHFFGRHSAGTAPGSDAHTPDFKTLDPARLDFPSFSSSLDFSTEGA